MDIIGMDRVQFSKIRESLSEYEQGILDSNVIRLRVVKMGKKMMVCHLTCANGFEVIGEAGCEDPDKFVDALGWQYSLKDALNKLGAHMAYARAEAKASAGTISEERITRACYKAIKAFRSDERYGRV